MTTADAALLVVGGILCGAVNTLAGGASVVSVPLLVLVGLPGNVANGTNRLGIFVMSAVAALRFRAEGVSGFRAAGPVLIPIALGSLAGAYTISLLSDELFEKIFAGVMVLLLVPMLRRPPVARETAHRGRIASPLVSFFIFFSIGLYGGAFQAGVGLLLVFALSYAGYGLVRANSIKTVVNTALTMVALPVFALKGQVAYVPGLILACGYAAGAALGVRAAVLGGERIIRPVLAASVLALAGKMLGIY